MKNVKKITVTDFSVHKNQLYVLYDADGYKFSASAWYPDIDFNILESDYDADFFKSLYFHMLIPSLFRLINLRPDTIDLGVFSEFYTQDFKNLWSELFKNVLGQWRYENDIPFYKGPQFINKIKETSIKPITINNGQSSILHLIGGGKDSLVSMTLLEKMDIPFATYSCIINNSGPARIQQNLIKSSIEHINHQGYHTTYAIDNLTDSPIADIAPQYKSNRIDQPETLLCIFQSLPFLLKHGYNHIILGNERSSDDGNLIWDKTGEDINHQWLKTSQCETLLNSYFNKNLLSDFKSYSLLRPIYDVLIFSLLSDCDSASISNTHSCNLHKPWCYTCSKCAYIWLNYMAYLPENLVNRIFRNRNLFDMEENQQWYRDLLGLGNEKPFECVGNKEEVYVAFELCKRKGIKGKAMDIYENELNGLDFKSILDKCFSIKKDQHNLPQDLAVGLFKALNDTLILKKKNISEIILGSGKVF